MLLTMIVIGCECRHDEMCISVSAGILLSALGTVNWMSGVARAVSLSDLNF